MTTDARAPGAAGIRAQPTTAPALSVRGATLTFGGITALDAVTFDAYPGETVGVIGPNGAGKTALLNCICGTYRLRSGEILINGRAVQGLRPQRIAAMGMARTFQSTDHFNEFTVLDYVLLGRTRALSQSSTSAALRLPGAARRERVERAGVLEMLQRLGFVQYAATPLSALPYGMQRRIDLLRVEAAQARLILLDEPTSGTMSGEREMISQAIRDLSTPDNTLLIVDHDVEFILSHCDRVVAMSAGGVISVGLASEVFADARVKKAFLGFIL